MEWSWDTAVGKGYDFAPTMLSEIACNLNLLERRIGRGDNTDPESLWYGWPTNEMPYMRFPAGGSGYADPFPEPSDLEYGMPHQRGLLSSKYEQFFERFWDRFETIIDHGSQPELVHFNDLGFAARFLKPDKKTLWTYADVSAEIAAAGWSQSITHPRVPDLFNGARLACELIYQYALAGFDSTWIWNWDGEQRQGYSDYGLPPDADQAWERMVEADPTAYPLTGTIIYMGYPVAFEQRKMYARSWRGAPFIGPQNSIALPGGSHDSGCAHLLTMNASVPYPGYTSSTYGPAYIQNQLDKCEPSTHSFQIRLSGGTQVQNITLSQGVIDAQYRSISWNWLDAPTLTLLELSSMPTEWPFYVWYTPQPYSFFTSGVLRATLGYGCDMGRYHDWSIPSSDPLVVPKNYEIVKWT